MDIYENLMHIMKQGTTLYQRGYQSCVKIWNIKDCNLMDYTKITVLSLHLAWFPMETRIIKLQCVHTLGSK